MPRESLTNFLVAELKAGNTRAFDKIFNDSYAHLCRYANSILHDEDIARSMVQNAFMKLWENRMQLGNITDLTPYIVTMVRNDTINYLRRQQRMITVGQMPDHIRSEPETDDIIMGNELNEKLAIALISLPDRCREAFEYSRFENLPNREIAEKMQISVKGVEALITRTLKILRSELKEYLPSSKGKPVSGGILFFLARKLQKIHF